MRSLKEPTERKSHRPNTLLIIDYSGTLSPEMSRFADADNLVRVLRTSGLAAYGVERAEEFWERVVNPTWKEGSTSQVGYARTIVRALGEERDARLCRAAEVFVREYMGSAVIDERWGPLLNWLLKQEWITLLVATDHYAEATAVIVKELGKKGIPAVPLELYSEEEKRAAVVANSSDLGCLKSEEPYWEKVKKTLRTSFDLILLVDDFGSAEEKGDAYREGVIRRCQRTIDSIYGVFHLPVKVFAYQPWRDFSAVEKWIKRQVSSEYAILSRSAHQ